MPDPASTPPGVVLPTHDDPVARAASEGVGGPAGSRVLSAQGWWNAVRVALALAAVACALGYLQKLPCRNDNFAEDVYTRLCYTDIAPLYDGRGFGQGALPYVDTGDWDPLEYPVLSGAFMTVAAWVTHALDGDGGTPGYVFYFDVTVVLLAAFALLGCWFVARTNPQRPWDAVMIAPGLVLAAYINWDLLVVALLAGALWAWSRGRPLLAGVLLGLGGAAKLYPLLVLGPLFLVCLRERRMPEFLRAALGALWTWLLVNVPVLLAAPAGWATFYQFSRERSASYGSIWYALGTHDLGIPSERLNAVAGGMFLLACVGIGWLALAAPEPPRLAQLAFLVVAAFALTNKVYSPQYMLWLVFLFPLARPRWRDYSIWLGLQALYFVAIWWHLEGLTNPDLELPNWPHTLATLGHMTATLVVCGLIVRDVLRPECDPVRSVSGPPSAPCHSEPRAAAAPAHDPGNAR